MRTSDNRLYGSTLAIVAVTLMPAGVRGLAPDAAAPCLSEHHGVHSQRTIRIPDDDDVGVRLGPLSVSTPGTLAEVAVALSISHSYAGDLALTLQYDADRDGTPDARAPLAICFARRDLCLTAERHGCPVDLFGTYTFRDAVHPDTGHEPMLDAFAGLPANGDWYLAITDRSPGDTGTISGWSVYAATRAESLMTNAEKDRKGTLGTE